MREKFPYKRPGQVLSARHVNRLSKVAERFAEFRGGSHLDVSHNEDGVSINAPPPWKQRLLKITQMPQGSEGFYRAQEGYYDYQEQTWKVRTDTTWKVDSVIMGNQLQVGDVVVAYWDRQRGAWIPIPTTPIRRFELQESLNPEDSAEAKMLLWQDGELVTAEDIVVVHEVVGTYWGLEGDIVGCQWFNDSNRWEVVIGRRGLKWFECTTNCIPPRDYTVMAEDAAGIETRLYLKSSDPGDANRPLGVLRGGVAGHQGSQVYAAWSREYHRWEVITGQFETTLFGNVNDPGGIPGGGSGHVSLVWPVVQEGNVSLMPAGEMVKVANWAFPDIPDGTRVAIAFDPVYQLWLIIGVGPYVNDQLSVSQEVVTSVNFGDQTTQTKTLELAWWNEVS